MKRFYQLIFTIVVVFTLVIGTSHLAFAQGEANIDDGPLNKKQIGSNIPAKSH